MTVIPDTYSYVHDVEEHLRLILFGADTTTDSQAAVLLARGSLADSDLPRVAQLGTVNPAPGRGQAG